MYGSPARLRVEHEVARRTNGSVVISTLLSLLVVAAAVAVVVYLVVRAPSSPVDSAERLEPVGTALPAPADPPTLPTPMPTAAPEPTALGFTGEAPEVAGLPTVAAPEEAGGPTPTPRVVALPTAVPPTAVPPPPTLPPSVAVDQAPVSVEALAPVEAAPAVAPTAAPSRSEDGGEPAPQPVERDDDPFNIFGDGDGSGIVPAQNEALERARALQEDAGRDGDAVQIDVPEIDIPEIVPAANDERIVTGRDGTVEIVMPDVDAMIEEITARATDPNRNPNVGDAGRSDNESDETRSNNRRKSARDRINERSGRRATSPNSRPGQNVVVPGGQDNGGNHNPNDCEDPFANLPADMRPDNFPFDNC